MKAMTPTAADVQFRTRKPAAAGPAVIAISDYLMLAMQSPGASGLGLQDGIRTTGREEDGKHRSPTVTHGQQRTLENRC
jgi:hypothetical protein